MIKSIIVLLSLSVQCYGQISKIKVKKSTTETDIKSVVTIGGLYEGSLTLEQLYFNSKFKVSNNVDSFKVIAYEAYFIDNRKFKLNQVLVRADSLTELVKEKLFNLNPASKVNVFFMNIKGVNRYNDTLYLNPIHLKLGR